MNLLRDLRFTLRGLAKRPGFTIVVVLTLASGIGTNTALFSVVHAVLLDPLPFHEADRVAMLSEHSRAMDTGLVSPITFDDWKTRNEVFSDLAAFRHWENRTLEFQAGQPEPILQVTASPNYFQVLGLQPLFGRTFGEEKAGGTNEAVLSHELWSRRFAANRDVIGTAIRISGAPFVVVGVMPPAPHDMAIGWGDVWTPIHWYNLQQNRATSYRARYLRVLGRLKPAVSMAQAQSRMDVLQRRLEQEATSVAAGYSARVESLETALSGRFRPALLILFGAVGIVLLTACANVANLMLARGVAREKETALRSALGASRARLAGGLLLESGVLSLAGAGLGLVVAHAGLWFLKYALAARLPRLAEAGLSAPVLLFTLALAVVSAVLFSLAPLTGFGSRSVHETLKEAGRTGGGVRRQRLRTVLVAAEFAFASLLLVGAGLLLKSFARLLDVHPGFETANRVTVDVIVPANQYADAAKRIAFYRDLLRRLNETPGMKASGGALYFPCRSKLWLSTIWREGVPVARGQEPIVYYNLYAGDYFRAMGIPLLRGRLPTEKEMWEPSDAILINETMARQVFGNIDPLERRIKTGEDEQWNKIVGVVGDVRQKSLDEPPKAEMYAPFSQMPMTFLTIVTHTDLPGNSSLRAIRNAIRKGDPAALPGRLTPLGELAGGTIATRRFALLLMLLFAALALALSGLGAYGVVAQAVTQRTAEIGVRMALGAAPSDVLRLVLGQSLRTAAAGTAAGLVLALAASKALASLLYNVDAVDAPVDFCIAMLAILVALLASYVPARRAMRISPVFALRQE
ncbi:MAG TPA: ABC transporter permease [Verrucomicrobiae bacterium]|nr:ABC transporter permease [Verrucomicrobiae bacterium]